MNGWDMAARIMEKRAAARRPRSRPATEAAELGGKIDKLTSLIERATSAYTPIKESAPAPAPEPAPAPVAVPTAAELVALSPDEFKRLSALRWTGMFDHLAAGSPYARSGGYGALKPDGES